MAIILTIGLLPLLMMNSWADGMDIRVGTKLSVPFTIQEENHWDGVAFTLWQSIADEVGIQYTVTSFDSIDELLQAVEKGEVDVGVGSITVNAEREKKVDFSHPYFKTGMGIATVESSGSIWSMLTNLLSTDFFFAVFSLLLVLFAVGVLIWLIERKRNAAQFGGNTLEGLGNGFWWSAVTMTTVGYGDKAPTTFLGRFVGVIWMFVSVITISGFTAAIASSITVKNLSSAVDSVDDLYRVRVATVGGSSSLSYLQQRGISFEIYPNLDDVLNALAKKKVDAVVYDTSLLKYTIKEKGLKNITILPENLLPQDYAFAFVEDSKLIEPVNQALLKNIASEQWQETTSLYFGP